MDSYKIREERVGKRVQNSGKKRAKTTKKITRKVLTEMFLHADSDAKKVLI